MALASTARIQELANDEIRVIELGPGDAPLAERGPARAFAYRLGFDGSLFVWASSEDFDPILRVTGPNGELLGEDDDSGGGTTAFLALGPADEGLASIVVAAAEPEALGTATLHVAESSESDATRTAVARARERIAEAEESRKAGDVELARAVVAEATSELLSTEGIGRSSAVGLAAFELGLAAHGHSDLSTARTAWAHALACRSRTLPRDHPELQKMRQNLAVAVKELGDLQGARALEEELLAARSRTLPDDHPDLQAVRMNFAKTLHALGDSRGAKELLERVVEIRERTLPDDHLHLQMARMNLAVALKSLGDLEGARSLQESVLEAFARTLPDDHPYLQAARGNLANTVRALGNLRAAGELQRRVLEVSSSTLPEDHPDLQGARADFAVTMKALGDLQGARTLEERVLEVRSRTLPGDHPDLQKARTNLAETVFALGDLDRARALVEQVLEVLARTLPDDHPLLQTARGNVARILSALGDVQGARRLKEKELEVRSRTLGDGHPDLQTARASFALMLRELGDLEGALALGEKALEVRARALPDDHPDLQFARQNVAATRKALGDLEGARALEEKVLEVRSATLPDDHPDLQAARASLAATLQALGDLERARALLEEVLRVFSRSLPEGHPDLRRARLDLAALLCSEAAAPGGKTLDELEQLRGRIGELLTAGARSLREACLETLADASSREAEERISRRDDELSRALSIAGGLGALAPEPAWQEEMFLTSESMRAAALASASITRAAGDGAEHGELRELESAERELVRRAARGWDGASLLEADLAFLTTRLRPGSALVSYRRYERLSIEPGEPRRGAREASLCAFVVLPARPGRAAATAGEGAGAEPRLVRVELGPVAPIEAAIERWRATLGSPSDARSARDVVPLGGPSLRSLGERVRELVFDPVRGALADATRIVVTLDDVLHLVPLDALPAERGFLGDELALELRCTLWELALESAEHLRADSRLLVVLGGVDYGVADDRTEVAAAATATATSRGSDGRWAFAPLQHTREEVDRIRSLFEQRFGEACEARTLAGGLASKAALAELAPRSRFVHLATHGYFEPDSVPSMADLRPVDAHTGLGSFAPSEELLRGLSPMVLCGLALSGANRSRGTCGELGGVITAEELARLDLSSCELAVLSACDTNVGVRRAGQGVASLQRALRMAGARSVVTSLWKVPDEATMELMIDFYRRMWVEGKPKRQALWEAKTRLRDAVNEHGGPRYELRDWAAWVLTGEPE